MNIVIVPLKKLMRSDKKALAFVRLLDEYWPAVNIGTYVGGRMNYYTILNAANRLAVTSGFTIKSQKPDSSIFSAPSRRYYLVDTDNQVVPISRDSDQQICSLQELLSWFSTCDNEQIAASAKSLLSDLLSEQYHQVIEVKCRLEPRPAVSRAF